MAGEDDDGRLWRSVTEDVTPLGKKRGAASRRQPSPSRSKQTRTAQPSKPPSKPPPKPANLPPLVVGASAGVDKRTAQRLMRGKIEFDGRLDLHGLTQAEAHARLDGFLARAYDRGLRCVLIITGKGRVSEGGGVLRRMVPLWLNTPPNRAYVLSISEAQPKHGGAGALYALIKRKR